MDKYLPVYHYDDGIIRFLERVIPESGYCCTMLVNGKKYRIRVTYGNLSPEETAARQRAVSRIVTKAIMDKKIRERLAESVINTQTG